MKADVWMPLYIGDYLADTIGLTYAEHGAYLLTIMAYWRKGGPLTEAELNKVVGPHKEAIFPFFKKDGDLWKHNRIDREITAALEMRQKKSEAGKRGNAIRWGQQSDRRAIAERSQKDRPSPSPKKKNNKEQKVETFISEDFGISENVKAWAKAKGHVDLEKHLSYFKNVAIAKGYKYVDWDRAFMNAIIGNWAKLPIKPKTYAEMTDDERKADFERRKREEYSGWA